MTVAAAAARREETRIPWGDLVCKCHQASCGDRRQCQVRGAAGSPPVEISFGHYGHLLFSKEGRREKALLFEIIYA